jgi:hypothetical protein
MNTHESLLEIKSRMAESIIGQETVIDRLLIAILCNGNVLMEGLPGLAKTRAIKSLSKCIASDFSRIQFTPDLLPSDVTGTEVYYSESGKGEFRFLAGTSAVLPPVDVTEELIFAQRVIVGLEPSWNGRKLEKALQSWQRGTRKRKPLLPVVGKLPELNPGN